MLLPINKSYFASGKNGTTYRIEISIDETHDRDKHPEGVKAIFRMLKITEDKESLVALMDNHKPFGFHYHNKLPALHDSRESIDTDSWQEAWVKFQEICKEILNEF